MRVLEVTSVTNVADYFVIATGTSRPHVKALYDEIHYRMKSVGEVHTPAEGGDMGWWILMDFGDVVVHLMQPEAREYYDLEGLWGEALEVDWRAVPPPGELASRRAGA